MSLGIGDGANDVGMLISANVGVGIRGKEGLQAVRAADFSITEFKYAVHPPPTSSTCLCSVNALLRC